MANITEIGITAGDIWHYLDEQVSATLDELVSKIGASREHILLSLGWLAREGHVCLDSPENGYRAVLTEKERI